MTTTKYDYAIRTENDLSIFEAGDINEAARLWAEQKAESLHPQSPTREKLAAVQDVADLIAYIEAIEGEWMWIESDDAPDGLRQYAGEENME